MERRRGPAWEQRRDRRDERGELGLVSLHAASFLPVDHHIAVLVPYVLVPPFSSFAALLLNLHSSAADSPSTPVNCCTPSSANVPSLFVVPMLCRP